MARKENDLTCCSLTQQLQPEFWNWTDAEKKTLLTEDAVAIASVVKTRLESIGCDIAEMYAIIHNQDVQQRWDDVAMAMVLDYKTHHIHIFIKFKKGATLSAIATASGLEPQFIEKAGRGRYGYDNLISYPTHIKYPEKHQYSPDEVKTLCGRPYTSVYAERKEDWEKGRAKVQATKARMDIDWLEEKILSGEVTRPQIMLTDEYFTIYSKNKRRCDDAFTVYGERKAYKSLQLLQDGMYNLSVIFIQGQSGQGKTRFAKSLMESLIVDAKTNLDEDWLVYNGATNNVLDDYTGEEIIFLDDLRGNSMAATDWLRLLDPYNASPASARFKNKSVVASRVVIITATQNPYTFFYYTKNRGNVTEALDQFIRRISACVKVYNVNDDGSQVFGIAESSKIEQYSISLNNNPVPVSYGFPAELELDRDAAINYASSLVMHNHRNKSIKDGYEKLGITYVPMK